MPKYKAKLMKTGAHKGEYRYTRVMYAKSMDSVPDKGAKKEEYRGRLTGKARVEHEKLLKRIDNMSDAEYKAYRKKWHEPRGLNRVGALVKNTSKEAKHQRLLDRIDKMSDTQYKAYRKKWHEPSAEQMKKYHAQRRKEKKKRCKKRKD